MEEVEARYQMLMNRHLIVSVAFIFLFGCSNISHRENKKNDIISVTMTEDNSLDVTDTLLRMVPLKEFVVNKLDDVLPDTTINSKLHLEDHTTLEIIYSKSNCVKLIEQIRSSPVAFFTNINGKEYLLAYQYEGDTKNSFGCFEIGYRKDFPKLIPNETKELIFQTESGLRLGMLLSDLHFIKGQNYYTKELLDSSTVLIYRINDLKTSSFLRRYNMPGYFIEITFRNEKVAKILFGFDYP